MVWLLLVALAWLALVVPAGFLLARRLRRSDRSAEARRIGARAMQELPERIPQQQATLAPPS